jgi:ElaB/YqjD/DUF883 family membrane-anchored ribosome-binding protein
MEPSEKYPSPTHTGAAIADSINQAVTGTHNAIDMVAGAARPAVDRLASGAHDAVNSASGMATDAAQSLDKKADQLKALNTQLMDACQDYIHDHPLASLGMAFSAGFLIRRLLSSR